MKWIQCCHFRSSTVYVTVCSRREFYFSVRNLKICLWKRRMIILRDEGLRNRSRYSEVLHMLSLWCNSLLGVCRWLDRHCVFLAEDNEWPVLEGSSWRSERTETTIDSWNWSTNKERKRKIRGMSCEGYSWGWGRIYLIRVVNKTRGVFV
jgi:hypothetical protein